MIDSVSFSVSNRTKSSAKTKLNANAQLENHFRADSPTHTQFLVGVVARIGYVLYLTVEVTNMEKA